MAKRRPFFRARTFDDNAVFETDPKPVRVSFNGRDIPVPAATTEQASTDAELRQHTNHVIHVPTGEIAFHGSASLCEVRDGGDEIVSLDDCLADPNGDFDVWYEEDQYDHSAGSPSLDDLGLDPAELLPEIDTEVRAA